MLSVTEVPQTPSLLDKRKLPDQQDPISNNVPPHPFRGKLRIGLMGLIIRIPLDVVNVTSLKMKQTKLPQNVKR